MQIDLRFVRTAVVASLVGGVAVNSGLAHTAFFGLPIAWTVRALL